MFIQIGYQEYFDISSFNSLDDLVEELNDLLGENSYIIERNGKKIDLSNEHQLVDEETYKIWPKVLGGKVNIEEKFSFRNIRFFLLGWFWIIITFIW
jgi:hypothetical protein